MPLQHWGESSAQVAYT